MPFVEDFTRYLVDFGQAATLDGVAVRGIFDEPAGNELGGIAATEPQFQVPTVQVPPAPMGKTLLVSQGGFVVREHLPDGTGMSLLLLTRL